MAPQKASSFIAAMYMGLARDAHDAVEPEVGGNSAGFDALMAEQTPGGLNKAGIKIFRHTGVGQVYENAMARTLDRLVGPSG